VIDGAQLCFGKVMHRRLRPVQHRFAYGVFFVRLPLSKLAQSGNAVFGIDRFALTSFMRKDHGPRDGTSLEAWMRGVLSRGGITAADGEIVLQAFPRVLGYVFNPISIWYCCDRAGALRAVLCEVNNTFGERHDYLLAHDDQRPIVGGEWLTARKVFHVSPFCEVKGEYRFRFAATSTETFAQIDYYDSTAADGRLLVTTVHGAAEPATARAMARAVACHPLMTFAVIARIHWQALRLWLKRVPFFSKPEPPAEPISR